MVLTAHLTIILASVLSSILIWPLVLSAEELVDADEITACVRANRPAGNTLETVELTSTDRIGYEHVKRGSIHSGHSRDAFRTLYVRLIYPSDLSGSTFLIAERDGTTRMFVSVAGFADLKRISTAGGNPELFGTDFSAEDLARLYGMNRPGQSRRLEDSVTEGRPTYVIEIHSLQDHDSSYEIVISHVDKDTCVVLKSELYERSERLRKVFTASASSQKRVGSWWIAHELLMRDLRDETQTRLVVERVETGDRVRDLPIRVEPPDEVGSGPSKPD